MTGPSPGVDVDLSALQRFVDLLERSTEQILKPGAARAEREIQSGVGIGRAFPGGHIAAAREVLIHAVARVRENAGRHLRATEILSTAIRRALETYAATDRETAVRLSRIEQLMAEAVATAEQAIAPKTPPSTGLRP